MATFQEVRDLLGVACFEDIIEEDELLLLWVFNTSKNLDCPYGNYNRFDLDEMYDSECIEEFRVKKCDLPDFHVPAFMSIAFPSGLIANIYDPAGEDICNSSILFLKRRTPSL